MEVSDRLLVCNKDWDPSYLQEIFEPDFYDFSHMWNSDVSDNVLVCQVENIEKYSPITEDITMDDDILCSAVEQIEKE